MFPRLTALFLIAGALAAAAPGAGVPARPAVVSAAAYGISILVPGQPASVAAEAAAPGSAATGVADAFVFPADGSLIRTGALSSSVSSRATGTPGAQAVTDILGVTLFNGEVTAESVAARAKAGALGADAAGSGVVNLVVFGTPVPATPNLRIQLGDWGYLIVLEQVVEAPVVDGTRNARGAVNALRVVLTADHAGLPAGTAILIGHAEAATSVELESPETSAVTTAKPRPPTRRPQPIKPQARPRPDAPRVVPGIGGPLFATPPQNISAPLSPKGYVFPVYGEVSFGDTWGAPRASTGRHQGTDIFAPLGAPILAAADGTLFSVGWNKIGGWRFWLRDRQGNQFYYAHLAAYSAIARDNVEVRAGQVIGFNGNSGDAQGTPFHVHFEIHPVGLLPLGYEGGAVNPFDYLSAWRRVEDVSFAVGRGWAPPVPANATAPRPAAILLGSTDISSASGLDPGSLDRALAAPVSQGDSAVLGAG